MKKILLRILILNILFSSCTKDANISNRLLSKEKISNDNYIEYEYSDNKLSKKIDPYVGGGSDSNITKFLYDSFGNISRIEMFYQNNLYYLRIFNTIIIIG